jgi:hypothetical protein
MGFRKNRAEFVPQNAQPFVQGKAAGAHAGGVGQEVDDGVDAGAGKLGAGGNDGESLRFEQGHGAAQVPGMADQHDAPDAGLLEQRRGKAGVVPGGERGVLDPAWRHAVFGLQDVLHDAALGCGAAVWHAASDQDGHAAGALEMGGVAQTRQAEVVEGVAAILGRVGAPSATEDDDSVRRLQFGRADRDADFQAFLQQPADPGSGKSVQRGGGQQDQRSGQAGVAASNGQTGCQQDHQHKRRKQGGGDKIGGKPGGHCRDCMPARIGIRRQCLTLFRVRS